MKLATRRLVVCLGSGGVGKTTTSAVLALNAACNGRNVEVITIDPAPRLLDALGLHNDATEPREVALESVKGKTSGRLRAMRLDPKRTFDSVIERYAPSPAAREMILNGRIYQNLSSSLAGVADYMAIERLLELYLANEQSLIVLDTPPAHAVIDFLDAPRRMGDLIGSRAISLLGASRGLLQGPFSLIDAAARMVLTAFDRITGLHLLADVQEFARNFEGMYDGFAARAVEAERLMHDERTLIAVITTPAPDRVSETLRFATLIAERGLRVEAIVVNRTIGPLPNCDEIDRAKLPALLRRKLHRNLNDFATLKQRERASIERLRAEVAEKIPILAIPELEHEPRSLSDLAAAAQMLTPFATGI